MNSMEENKGTGAGGSNTNKNGLPYEEFTDLKSNTIHIMDNVIEFKGYSRTFIKADKSNLHKYMNKTNQIQKLQKKLLVMIKKAF